MPLQLPVNNVCLQHIRAALLLDGHLYSYSSSTAEPQPSNFTVSTLSRLPLTLYFGIMIVAKLPCLMHLGRAESRSLHDSAHLSCVDVNSKVCSVPHKVCITYVVLWNATPQDDHARFVRCSLHGKIIDESHILNDVTPAVCRKAPLCQCFANTGHGNLTHPSLRVCLFLVPAECRQVLESRDSFEPCKFVK